MRLQIRSDSVNLWLSARETEDWATRPGHSWPCSTLAGRRFFVHFDRHGLCDLTIDGRYDADCDVHELNAITADFLRAKLPTDHPCRFICVDQFEVTL